MKFKHVVRGSKKTALPRNFIFVDTEGLCEPVGDVEFQYLRLGVACSLQVRDGRDKHTERWLTFHKSRELWRWLDTIVRPKQKYYLYAHNWHYDFATLDGAANLAMDGWELKGWFINSNIFIMKYKKGEKKLLVLDSGNILKEKLAKIARTMDMEKGEVDFFDDDDDVIIPYCHEDVNILKEWIMRWRNFLHKHDLGTYKFTLAAQAMEAYKHRFMNHEIFIHDNSDAYELERRGYFGGRTECFYIGEIIGEDFFMMDVNSMYPFVMKKYRYPVKLVTLKHGCNEKYLNYVLKRHDVIADVDVSIDEPCIPKRGERLTFPVGSFRTTLCTPELKHVMKHGTVNFIEDIAVYQRKPIFKEYVDFFYGLKKELDPKKSPVDYKLSKLFLNSLYGKFGQYSQNHKEIARCPPGDFFTENGIDAETGKIVSQTHISGKIFQAEGKTESLHSFPAIAAHVTAHARLYLWSLICKAGPDNVYYTDTDSLLVNRAGYDRLKHSVHGTRLGALDLEFQTDEVLINGPKDYVMGLKYRLKGIREDAEEIEPGVFSQIQFMKTKGMLRKGYRGYAVIKRQEKRLARIYKKGKIEENGRVSPYSLNE